MRLSIPGVQKQMSLSLKDCSWGSQEKYIGKIVNSGVCLKAETLISGKYGDPGANLLHSPLASIQESKIDPCGVTVGPSPSPLAEKPLLSRDHFHLSNQSAPTYEDQHGPQ